MKKQRRPAFVGRRCFQTVEKAAKEQKIKVSPAFSKGAVCRWHTIKAPTGAGAETAVCRWHTNRAPTGAGAETRRGAGRGVPVAHELAPTEPAGETRAPTTQLTLCRSHSPDSYLHRAAEASVSGAAHRKPMLQTLHSVSPDAAKTARSEFFRTAAHPCTFLHTTFFDKLSRRCPRRLFLCTSSFPRA